MMKWLKCFFYGHRWSVVSGTWKATGKNAVDWAARIVPEYQCLERCDCCGKTQHATYISLAD